jgi:predicted nuclease of predicted toxin-antitoxin system
LKFLANENIPLHTIKTLREKGYNVISVAEENQGAADVDVLYRAHHENLIIITFDRDYG